LLRAEGWACNHKRVERIWRREGLKVPARQPKRSRLWLNDGSCVRLRPERANQVWAYDFVEDRTRDGRKLRMLNVVDEFTRECLAIRVARKLGSADVIDVLVDLFIARGTPGYIRSDNGPEFVATAVKGWIGGVGAKTAYIEPGSPWENGYVESFNGKLRDELLNAGCRRGCGGKGWWRSLRIVATNQTGVRAPAETTPWKSITRRRRTARGCSRARPGSTRSRRAYGTVFAGSSRNCWSRS